MILTHIVSIRLRWFCAIVTLSSVFVLSSSALAADKCGSLDRVAMAVRLTQVLYPELKGKEFSLQFSEGTGGPLSSPADVRSFLIAVDKPKWHPPANEAAHTDSGSQSSPTPGDDIELPLYFNFSFIDFESVQRNVGKDLGGDLGRDLVCRPLQFRNDAMTNRMKEVRALINAHPEWSDAKELEAATEHGLRFGPDKKNAVLGQTPLKELAAFYGPLKIKGAEFDIHGNGDKCAGCSFADLHWSIDAEEVGTGRTLQITIEPFNGKIDGISEHRQQK
jgi:hypothetical protein